jgi:hypothetical protein
MVATWRPDLVVQAAWNADPNDPAAVPSWSNLTSLFLGASSIKRGKQYELDQDQASQPTLDFLDPNEYLNPGNPSSIYAPNLLPERQILMQAQWPNSTVGNLLPGQGIDPSFEAYSAGTVLSWILTVGAGVAPTASTSNPQQGTKSLQYVVTSGGGTNGVGLVVNCIPGRQYTSSLYVRQTAANTTQIFINGGASGAATATTGAYVRLTVTWTATQTTHQLWVASFTTGASGTVNVDAIQHEQAASASAFTTSGPTIYGVLLDYIEELPAEWDQDSQGYLGLCSMTAVDAFAALEAVDLWTEYRNAVLAKKPDYYWPLAEGTGAASFAEASGNNGPTMQRFDGPLGAATVTPGTATNIAGDPSGVGVQFSNSHSHDSELLVGNGNRPQISVGSNAAAFGMTISCWFSTTDASLGGLIGVIAANAVAFPQFQLVGDVSGKIVLNLAGPGASPGFVNVEGPASYIDGNPHLAIGVVSQAANSTTVTIYMDGTAVATSTVNTTTTFGSSAPDFRMQRGFISCGNLVGATGGSADATIAHKAVWNRALTAGEITDLWNAGQGYPGETSGARITRYLGYGWNGTTAIDTGQSTMGISDLAAGTSLLAACQGVTTTENGNFFVNSAGAVTFQSRTRRYLATTPAYVFGENTAGGELPYAGDVRFAFDNLQIYNDVQVTRSGGIVAAATDATSKKRYFPRTYQRTINTASDLEAVDASTWILASHKDPVQRVDQITLDPVGYPALWPVVFSLEIGTRVTCKKRSPAANGGAGLTQSADFFVESIEHTGIDMEAGTWKTILLLSPAAPALQSWILGDATYGVLDTTTRLGY